MIDVKFFPAEQITNNNIGNGYIRSGLFSVRFSAWLNPKFSQGFSIKLPTRKVGAEYKDEVTTVNREASDAMYAAVLPHVQPFLGNNTVTRAQPRAQASGQGAKSITKQTSPAGTGAPGPSPW